MRRVLIGLVPGVVRRTALVSLFVLLPHLIHAQRIAAGDNFTLIVKPDGSVWGFGENQNGQVGDGTTTDRPTPTQVQGVSGIQAIAAGAFHCSIVTVHLTASVGNPLVVSPAIDYDVTVVIDFSDISNHRYTVEGTHDGFPNYEVFINEEQVWGYAHGSQTPFSLFPPMERIIGPVQGVVRQ